MDDDKHDNENGLEEENISDSDTDYGDSCDENEVDELLEEGLPEHFRRAPKRRKLMPQEHDLIQNLVSTGAAKSDGEVKEEKGDNEGLEAGELEEEKEEDSGSTKYNEKVVLILEEKGKSKFDDLPGGWIQVRHVSGMPIYLHRKTRVCTLSKPYRLGAGSARRHSMPLSAIPCLAYRKALDREAALANKENAACEDATVSVENPNTEVLALEAPVSVPEEAESVVENQVNEHLNGSTTPQQTQPHSIFSTPSDNGASQQSVPSSPAVVNHTSLDRERCASSMEVDDELEPGEIQDDEDSSSVPAFTNGSGSEVAAASESTPVVVKTEQSACPVTGMKVANEGETSSVEAVAAESALATEEFGAGRKTAAPIRERLKLFMDEKPVVDLSEINADEIKNLIPKAQVETSQEANELNSVTADELREYCMSLFKFKQVKCKRFKSWRDRRKHTKEQKRLNLQRPTLPEGVQLITFPVQRPAGDADSGKAIKEYTMNPQGKSSVCILHEYVQHALRTQPSYTFGEIRNSAAPYAATVMINNVKYGSGYGTSKKLAKAAAAAATLEILIPKMKDVLKTSGTTNNELYHIGYFDQVEMDDPRIPKMCASVSEPSPYALLLACLQRNFGQGSTSDIKFEVVSTNGQANRFRMQTGEYSVEVTASNKREGKQLASQALLCKIHPHIKNFGSFLRLYGNGSIKSVKEKKQEEQQITTLQSKASANSPNYAILNKLKEEMLKLKKKRIEEDQKSGRINEETGLQESS